MDIEKFMLVCGLLIGLTNIVLIYSVCSIRDTVDKAGRSLPNQRFLRAHFILFILAGFLQFFAYLAMAASLYYAKKYEFSKDDGTQETNYRLNTSNSIIICISGLFNLIVAAFVLWLILGYMNSDSQSHGIKDTVLNRKVPNIVYILNKKMLKDVVMDELANDELKKQEFRVRAQAHAYMYDLFKK